MIHDFQHILGLCADSKAHLNILGFLLEPQLFQITFNYLKTWRI
jgi:hypothetical protein